VSQDLYPRVTLRAEDLAEIYDGASVTAVKIYVADQDWQPFLGIAQQGMEIPVRVEGAGEAVVSVLIGLDHENRAITVVI